MESGVCLYFLGDWWVCLLMQVYLLVDEGDNDYAGIFHNFFFTS